MLDAVPLSGLLLILMRPAATDGNYSSVCVCFVFFSEKLRIERKSICLQMDVDDDGNSLLSMEMTSKIAGGKKQYNVMLVSI